jgi:hypothetical protein
MMSKITVGIESDALDLIIHQTLVEDYRSLCDEVRRLEKKVELRTFEQEDLDSTRKWRDGLEAMLSYYLMPDKAQEIIDEEYIKNEYSSGVTNAEFIDEYAPDDVLYYKDLKEKRIEMLEEQVEHLMKAHHSHPLRHPLEPTFNGRKIQTDQWGKRYIFNENGIRTYLEPFDD